MLSNSDPADYSWFERSLEAKKRYRLCGTPHYKYYRYVQQGMTERSMGLPVRRYFEVTRDADDNDVYEVVGSHSMNPGIPDGAAVVEKTFGVKLPVEMHDFYRRWGGGYLMLGEFHYLLSPAEIVRVSNEFRESHGFKKDKDYRVLYFCDLDNSNYLVYFKKGDRWKITYFHHELGHEHYLNEFDELPTFASSFYLWLYNTIIQDGSLPLVETDLRSINPQAPPFERLPLLAGDD